MVYIYTEGKDETFIKCHALRLGFDGSFLKLIMTGGKDKIFSEEKFINNLDTQSRRAQDKIIIIFDLDNRDKDEYRDEIINKFEDINRAENKAIKIDDFFFLPNDKDAGCLEDLLISMMHTKPKEIIFACFDDYQKCVSKKGYKPTAEKGIKKAQVFSYLEAMGKPGTNSKRKYEDKKVWDFTANSLTPLTVFLKRLFP